MGDFVNGQRNHKDLDAEVGDPVTQDGTMTTEPARSLVEAAAREEFTSIFISLALAFCTARNGMIDRSAGVSGGR